LKALQQTVADPILRNALTTSGADGAFPGDNGTIAFTSSRDGSADIHVMAPDGV